MPEIILEIAKSSPAIALAGLLSMLFYKVSMRALDALEKNTKALTVLETILMDDRRKETRDD